MKKYIYKCKIKGMDEWDEYETNWDGTDEDDFPCIAAEFAEYMEEEDDCIVQIYRHGSYDVIVVNEPEYYARKRKKGFTLIELIIVIAIIMIIASCVVPLLVKEKPLKIDGKEIGKGDILYTKLGGDKVQVLFVCGDRSLSCRVIREKGNITEYDKINFEPFELTLYKNKEEQGEIQKVTKEQEEWEKEKW